jgi:AraC-like DNA-binding protein
VAPARQTIALIFPPVPAYSRELTEGVIELHLAHPEWAIIESPRLLVGQSPLPDGDCQIDGAIIWAEPRDLWVNDLLAAGIPVVNCGMEWLGTPGVASVHFDYGDIHAAVVEHFAELGLQRVTAIGHRLEQRPATCQVLNLFADAVRAAGMRGEVWELGGRDSPSLLPHRLLKPDNEDRLAAYLVGLDKPSGVYCLGDHIAFIVSAVAAGCGLRVPEDLAIVGHGNNLVTCFASPPLSTVAGAARAVGRAAAECLAEWLARGERPTEQLSIPGAQMLVRESSAGKSGSVILEAVRRRIVSQAKRGVTLGELVVMSGLSVKTLVRRYRAAFGIDPAEEIHEHRLQEAQRLLREGRLSIGEVAAACGFSSQAAFANFFRRHAGCSPSGFRVSAKRNRAGT